MSDYKPESFKTWVDSEPQNVSYPAGENVTYPVMPERMVTRSQYDQVCRERDEWKTRAAELMKPITADELADAASISRDEWLRLLLSLKAASVRVAELESRYVGQRADCGHLKSLTIGVLGSPISGTCVGCLADKAQARVAELERRDSEWVHDCGRLQIERDEAQAHAARLAETVNWIRSQLPPDDTYAFLSRLEGRVIVTLATTPAESFDYLEETLESFIQEPEAMQEIMRQHNLKIDNLDDPMQKLAFTFYFKIVAIAEHARAAVEAAKAKGGER